VQPATKSLARQEDTLTGKFVDHLNHGATWETIEKILLVIVLLDLALGGNGYLVKIGPLRLREVLFVLCIVWVALRLTCVNPIRLDLPLVYAFMFFVAVTAFGAIFGYLMGNRLGAIIAELKPLSYFPMFLFFLVALRSRKDVTLTARILVICGMLLALLYILLLLSAKFGLIAYSTIFNSLHLSDEFIFRHILDNQAPFVGFFYKGMFYVCIAALLVIFDPYRITKLLAAVAVTAVAMTMTRSLWVALAACILAGAVLDRNRRRLPFALGAFALLSVVALFALQAERNLAELAPAAVRHQPIETSPRPPETRGQAGQSSTMRNVERSAGDSNRIADIEFVMTRMDISTALVGRGLGAPIRGLDRIEMNYFEILYKQGLLGLSVWVFLLAYLFRLYLAVPAETKEFGLSFFLSGLFVFFATATNTFLTGSIGMAVVFISLAGLLVLAREERRPMERSDWYGNPLGRIFRAQTQLQRL